MDEQKRRATSLHGALTVAAAIALVGALSSQARAADPWFYDGCPADQTITLSRSGFFVVQNPSASYQTTRPGCPMWAADVLPGSAVGDLVHFTDSYIGTEISQAECASTSMTYVVARNAGGTLYQTLGWSTWTGNWFWGGCVLSPVNGTTGWTTVTVSAGQRYRFYLTEAKGGQPAGVNGWFYTD
jgi:hypothetical protein